MQIYLGGDHAGFELKEKLKVYLVERGHVVKDMGPFSFDKDDDYPDFVFPVARAVASDPESRGIIIGKSGQGEAMAANRVKGARAAVYYGSNSKILKLSREHNDANILSLAAGFLSGKKMEEAVDLWFQIPFSNGERHVRRIKKLDN